MVDIFKPVQISEYFLRQIAAGLKKEIYDSMFKQIFEVLNTNSIYNDKKTLTNAIQSGRIYYVQTPYNQAGYITKTEHSKVTNRFQTL